MAGVFISYRREDSPGHAGRVFDRVRARFGADIVFMDVTAIDAGADFVDAIEQAVGTCDVLLAIIGPLWVGAADSAGRKRLENPNDFIRLEIAGALKRNVRVVPVLVDDAKLPAAANLPPDLQPLLRRHAVELRDARWDADIDQLLASLERIVKPREEPLRLAAPLPHRRLRTLAALAVLAVSVGAAIVFGPRACAPQPPTTTTSSTPAATPAAAVVQPPAPAPSIAPKVEASPPPKADVTKEETPKADAPKPDTTKVVAPPPPNATVPNVVGRSLADARELLRRAGVDAASVLYRDDRTKAIDLVVEQTDVRTSGSSRAAVALTAVARAAVVIYHTPADAELARRLLGVLTAGGAAAGLSIRTRELPTLSRNLTASRVAYSDAALADTAADIAKDANAWLAQSDPGRPPLTASVVAPIVSRTIVIGLLEGNRTSSSVSAALPDVRGLTVAEARRTLSAAGVTAFDYKWSDDAGRKPLVVFGQAELSARAGGRMVGLEVGAKGTLLLYHADADAAIAGRFSRDIRAKMDVYGILVRSVTQTPVRLQLRGKVATSGTALSREARVIATFASDWLTKELGRTVTIDAVDDKVRPQQLTFGFPSLQ